MTLDECIECYDFEAVASANGAGSRVVCRRVPAGAGNGSEAQNGARRVLRDPVSTAATRDLVCVRPDVSVHALSETLLEYGADAAAVIDHRGCPIGVVSKTDVVRGTLDGSARPRTPLEKLEADPQGTVGTIMTPAVVTVDQTTPLGEAAAMMASKGIHQLPVVSDAGEVVAMLTTRDVLRVVASSEGFAAPETPVDQSP